MLGLLSELPRKNCWTIAEWAGEASPHVVQHLLCRASWDADAARDDVREYVVEHLHDEAAVLVVDETGDVKKGTHTGGEQRQYTGTAGRIENSQVAVHLVYAGARGHASVDRQLYIPRSWTCDPDRCRAAGLSEGHRLRDQAGTGPGDDRTVPGRRTPSRWVTGDEAYGGNPELRTALEGRGIGYVLAVACSAEVPTGAGAFRADAPAKKVPKRAWQKLSAGRGAKAQRVLRLGPSTSPKRHMAATSCRSAATAPPVGPQAGATRHGVQALIGAARPGGLLDLRAAGCAGLLVDLVLEFGAQTRSGRRGLRAGCRLARHPGSWPPS
ncbi:IS701 family transposase [Streptomyces sp. B4I13]|uniref:IS701 family transposase n=1 Tax=Streptomyces sp. B4I13 TaxID=3042271 RepID=UPI0027D8D3DB|nr:IS701 family transposase [Streptomyces sp. B4I13]